MKLGIIGIIGIIQNEPLKFWDIRLFLRFFFYIVDQYCITVDHIDYTVNVDYTVD